MRESRLHWRFSHVPSPTSLPPRLALTVERNRVRSRLETDGLVAAILVREESSSAVVLWLLWRLRVVEAVGLLSLLKEHEVVRRQGGKEEVSK